MRHATDERRGLAPASVDHRVRGMFERVLASWAMDVLALRRRGLDRPGVWIAPGRAEQTASVPRSDR